MQPVLSLKEIHAHVPLKEKDRPLGRTDTGKAVKMYRRKDAVTKHTAFFKRTDSRTLQLEAVPTFRKADVPVRSLPLSVTYSSDPLIHAHIIGLFFNMAYFPCWTCSTPHRIFGSLTSFHQTTDVLSIKTLRELPISPSVSAGGGSSSPMTLRNRPTPNT